MIELMGSAFPPVAMVLSFIAGNRSTRESISRSGRSGRERHGSSWPLHDSGLDMVGADHHVTITRYAGIER